MSYAPHTREEIEEMLQRIGAASLDELFAMVPASLRTRAELKLGPTLSEQSALAHLSALAERNTGSGRAASFLGGGAYHHFIPAAVDALASRSEFATAYTPYQGEVSQGTLQAIFEFQTLVCQLTGTDVANASLYDGAAATAEAVLMAMRITGRKRVVLSAGLHPRYHQVVGTYTSGIGAELVPLALDPDGRTPAGALDGEPAALVVQLPNYLGAVESLGPLAAAAHAAGALLVCATAEPLALAVLRPPGELDCDIVCGEAQSFGVPLTYGGPFVGFLASRQKFVRQLPGRLIGETVDVDGRRAFVMTLTTREQHIRRAKATSNICTNQGLCALRVAIYLALLGRRGLRELAETNVALAEYAKRQLTAAGLQLPYAAPTFNEFVVRVPDLLAKRDALVADGVLAGVALEELEPERRDELLVCTTEMNTREQIDRLARGLSA